MSFPASRLKTYNIKPLSEATTEKAALEMQRQGVDQIISDGLTVSRAQVQMPGTRGNLAGIAAATWRGLVTVPPANPAANAVIFGTSSSPSFISADALYAVILAGSATLQIRGDGLAGGNRRMNYAAFRTDFSGQTIELEIGFLRGITSPTIRINGVDRSSSFVLSTTDGGSGVPEWLHAGTASTYLHTGYNWTDGPAPVGCWILGTLTDSERAGWRASGKPPVWVSLGGSCAAKITNDGTALTPFSSGGGSALAVFDANATVAGKLYAQLAPAGVSWFYQNDALVIGQRYRVAGKCRLNSGVALALRCGGNLGGTAGLDFFTFVPGAVESAFSGVFTATTTVFRLGSASANGSAYEFDDITLHAEGALSLALIQRGGVIGDITSIGDNPARLVGMRAICDRKDFQWTATVDTASTGNKQLLGGAVFTDPLQIALDSIDRNGTGAETASVGDGTTAAKYSASAAKTATRNRLALADHYPADAAKTGLYYDVTVAGAAGSTARLTVRGHLIP